MKRLYSVIIPPLLCLLLLTGLYAQNRGHIKPADADAYHARARAAIDAVPYRIGNWIGRDISLPQAAIQLLRPNATLCREYIDLQDITPHVPRSATLLIVQTREARDMAGHYPRNCYVANGMTLASATPRDWKIGELTIGGMEYAFSERQGNEVYRTIVDNFLIVPGQMGIVRDIQSVYKAAGDYQQRYFGAAQFQVVFREAPAEELSQAERDHVFETLVGGTVPVIRALLAGGVQ